MQRKNGTGDGPKVIDEIDRIFQATGLEMHEGGDEGAWS